MRYTPFTYHLALNLPQPVLTALFHEALALRLPAIADLDRCRFLYVKGWGQHENQQSDKALGTFQLMLIAAHQIRNQTLVQAALRAIQLILQEYPLPLMPITALLDWLICPDSCDVIPLVQPNLRL